MLIFLCLAYQRQLWTMACKYFLFCLIWIFRTDSTSLLIEVSLRSWINQDWWRWKADWWQSEVWCCLKRVIACVQSLNPEEMNVNSVFPVLLANIRHEWQNALSKLKLYSSHENWMNQVLTNALLVLFFGNFGRLGWITILLNS